MENRHQLTTDSHESSSATELEVNEREHTETEDFMALISKSVPTYTHPNGRLQRDQLL